MLDPRTVLKEFCEPGCSLPQECFKKLLSFTKRLSCTQAFYMTAFCCSCISVLHLSSILEEIWFFLRCRRSLIVPLTSGGELKRWA